jgi:hypothetical protein
VLRMLRCAGHVVTTSGPVIVPSAVYLRVLTRGAAQPLRTRRVGSGRLSRPATSTPPAPPARVWARSRLCSTSEASARQIPLPTRFNGRPRFAAGSRKSPSARQQTTCLIRTGGTMPPGGLQRGRHEPVTCPTSAHPTHGNHPILNVSTAPALARPRALTVAAAGRAGEPGSGGQLGGQVALPS